jgi:hypothetical protein
MSMVFYSTVGRVELCGKFILMLRRREVTGQAEKTRGEEMHLRTPWSPM